MPIEIRELIIRATIVDPESGKAPVTVTDNGSTKKLQEKIVADCVEQVLYILKMQNDR